MVHVSGAPLLHPVVTVEFGGQPHVLYALQPKQLQCYEQTPLVKTGGPRHIGYGGAAGGAKSHTARSIAAAVAQAWPGSTTIIFRRTRPEVWNNHWVKFRTECPDFGRELYRPNATGMELTWWNGSRTLFGYLERDDHVFRYQGNEYDCIIFEEATQQSWFQVNWLTSNRMRSTVPGSQPFALYCSNPGGQGHFWFKRLFVDRKFDRKRGEDPSNYAFIHATVYDNHILLANDPQYVKNLESQPEPYRSWYLLGDFSAGAGQALNLNYDVHMIEPFVIPKDWPVFRSFDWGFSHPFAFGWYTQTPAGWLSKTAKPSIIKLHTISSNRLHDPEIIERVLHWESGDAAIEAGTVDVLQNHRAIHGGKVSAKYSVAGHDCWSDIRAKVENVPTTAETFAKLGVPLIRASVSRIAGLKNFRAYVHHDPRQGIEARFRLMQTDGNERCFAQLESMVVDPDNKEDALKIDADDFGEGGDDMYDETRYGLASRPIIPKLEEAKMPADQARQYDDRFDKVVKELQKRRDQRRGGGRAPLN